MLYVSCWNAFWRILEDGSHSPKAVNFFSVSRAKSEFVLYAQILHRSSMTYTYYLKLSWYIQQLLHVSQMDMHSSRIVKRIKPSISSLVRVLCRMCFKDFIYQRCYEISCLPRQASRIDALVYSPYIIFYSYQKMKCHIQSLVPYPLIHHFHGHNSWHSEWHYVGYHSLKISRG